MDGIKIKALKIAITQLGQSESPKGSNSGPMINKYLSSVGLGPGYSWCMAFVYWCYNEAAKEPGYSNPVYKTGGVMVQWAKSAKYRVTDPEPGDVFIMSFGSGKGHTGFVESVEGDTITTIEGNTNDDGSREGYEVARRHRKRSSILGFLRF